MGHLRYKNCNSFSKFVFSMELAKRMRSCLGFYPASLNNEAEQIIYTRALERVENWLRETRFLSREPRYSLAMLHKYAWDEGMMLFEHTRNDRALEQLLPSAEACHMFILCIALNLIGDGNSKRVNPKRRRMD